MKKSKFFIYFGERSGGMGDQLSRFTYIYTFITKMFDVEYICFNNLNMQHSEINFNNFLGFERLFLKYDNENIIEIDMCKLKEYDINDRLKKLKSEINKYSDNKNIVIKLNFYLFYENIYEFFNIKINFADVNNTKSIIKNSFYEINKDKIKNNDIVTIHARREDLTYCIYLNEKYYVFNFMVRNLAEKSNTDNIIEWIKGKREKQRVLLTDTIDNVCKILTKNNVKNIIIMTDGFKNLYKNFSKRLDNCHVIDLKENSAEYIETPEKVKNIIIDNDEFIDIKEKYKNIKIVDNNTINEDMLNLINSKLVIGSTSLFISTAKNYFNFNSTSYINYNNFENSELFYEKINEIN